MNRHTFRKFAPQNFAIDPGHPIKPGKKQLSGKPLNVKNAKWCGLLIWTSNKTNFLIYCTISRGHVLFMMFAISREKQPFLLKNLFTCFLHLMITLVKFLIFLGSKHLFCPSFLNSKACVNASVRNTSAKFHPIIPGSLFAIA